MANYGNNCILLIGEGNFSFSAALCKELELESSTIDYEPFLPSKVQEREKLILIATDFKPPEPDWNSHQDTLTSKNMSILKESNHIVLTDVDATELHLHPILQEASSSSRISKIIFNFPHVQRKKMHLGLNRELLRKFFQSAASLLPTSDIELVVTLCGGQSGVDSIEDKPRKWEDSWQIIEQASYGDFVLIYTEKFKRQDSYSNCGYRERSSNEFNADGANTFVFKRRPTLKPPEEINTQPNPFIELKKEILENFLGDYPSCNPVLRTLETLFNTKINPVLEDLSIEPNFSSISSTNCWNISQPFFHLWIRNILENKREDLLTTLLEQLELKIGSKVSIDKQANDKSLIKIIRDDETEFLIGDISPAGMISINISNLISSHYNILDEDRNIIYSNYFNGCNCGSLFPREHSFDVSFFLSEKFSSEAFIKLALSSYGLLLKSIRLLEIYNKKGALLEQVSHCYRIIIQSKDRALSRITANNFHLYFKEMLKFHLNVILR